MDSDSENEYEGTRRWKAGSHSASPKNVALKSFEPPDYVTLKEEFEDEDVTCLSCKTYKEKVEQMQNSLDTALHEKDKHELLNKALESELQSLKDSNSLSRQAVQTANLSLSRANEDVHDKNKLVLQQKIELQTVRYDLKEKEKLVKDLEEEVLSQHKAAKELKAQINKMEIHRQENSEWQDKQRKLEEEKEELKATNTGLQAEIAELRRQKKHDKEVIEALLDQIDEANAKINSSPLEMQQKTITVLGDSNAYDIGQLLEKMFLVTCRFEAFHHIRQLLDYAESSPQVLDKADLIFIHVGTIDITRGVAATQIRQDLDKAVHMLSKQSTPIFIATVPPIKMDVKHDIEVRKLNRYLNEIKEVTILDIYDDSEPSLAGDGYHLTKPSLERVAVNLADRIGLVVATDQKELHCSQSATIPATSGCIEKSSEAKHGHSIDKSEDDRSQQYPQRSEHTRGEESDEQRGYKQTREQSPKRSEKKTQRKQLPDRSDIKPQSERSPERSEITPKKEQLQERNVHVTSGGNRGNIRWRYPRTEPRLLIQIREEDIGHIIGKHKQNLIRLREQYNVDVTFPGNGKVLIVGDVHSAEEAGRDIEWTIGNVYKFKDRDTWRNQIPQFN